MTATLVPFAIADSARNVIGPITHTFGAHEVALTPAWKAADKPAALDADRDAELTRETLSKIWSSITSFSDAQAGGSRRQLRSPTRPSRGAD
jgi:hypothetical protein